jgi:NADH pyrophosphatase NudC (nudix superfamily)
MPDFFETVKRGIERSVSTVSVKSKEMLETTQLRSQVKTLEEEKQRALEELGSVVYTLYGQGKLEAEAERVKTKCASLAALDQKIRKKEDEVRQVQQRAQGALGRSSSAAVGMCSCGASILAGAKFCRGCGRKVEEILAQGASNNRCKRCGAEVSAQARFCGGCGAEVVEVT